MFLKQFLKLLYAVKWLKMPNKYSMKKTTLIIFFILMSLQHNLYAQEEVVIKNPVDSLYREDQFYINISYNRMQNTPYDYNQKGYFSNLGFGFLRDIPLNKRRNLAIAPGIGYSYNRVNSNLMILTEDLYSQTNLSDQNLAVIARGNYDKNMLTYQMLDVPIELRWRTSTPDSHKFFRVYTGVKLSYIFADKIKYKSSELNYKLSNIDEVKKFQTGIYLAVGYNTWNLYAYYGLTPLLQSKSNSGQEIKMNSLNLGLAFYIL